MDSNEVLLDRNMANFDIVNYKIVNNIYRSKCHVINELTQSGTNITNDDDYTAPDKIQLLSQRKLSFQKLFDIYCTLKEKPFSLSLTPDYRIELIEGMNPLVKESYIMLGKAKVREMKYHQSNIRREIIKRNNKGVDYKIVALIEESMQPPKPIAVAEVKSKLQTIYDELGLKRTAKATDLNDWYEIKSVTKEIKGKNTACVMIIRSKFMRLDTPEVVLM